MFATCTDCNQIIGSNGQCGCELMDDFAAALNGFSKKEKKAYNASGGTLDIDNFRKRRERLHGKRY
ncbi:hypothetical protein LCGC14_2356810 [marine sediment metagenome]|uniref:Uncharacterized protein n=1 Tax=marine sediment metagenome TaxID=412755 RepID=A0A0F9F2P1_9ZZZZ